ncbi:MAG: hypothetical protein JF588_08230 [Caulobacterales bacterium]|nr:hypothetical protein [Caulobacterales bacterium]
MSSLDVRRRRGFVAVGLAVASLALSPVGPDLALAAPARQKPAAPSCAPARMAQAGAGALVFEGQARSYLLALPSGYDGRRPYPLILDFHGHNGSKEKHDAATQMSAKGAARGFIVVTPDAIPPNWNVREEAGRAHDFAFVEALLAELGATLCIDEARIYAAGFSNGSAFAGLLACRPPNRFAAVAMAAGTPPLTCPKDVAPPTLFIRGTGDLTVPYQGGVLGGALTSTARYAAAYGCSPDPAHEPVMAGVERLRYGGCRDGGEVILDTVEGGAHVWAGGPKAALMPGNSEASRSFPATDEVLSFFERHAGRPWAHPAS